MQSISPSPSVGPASVKMSWALCALFTLVFAVIVFFTLSHHELWRDESQAWLMATQSHSFAQLWHVMRYEGHPCIWYVLLYALAHVSHNVLALQIMHALIATATALLVLRFAPFERWINVLLIFGYFLVYEYAVVARSYSLGVLGVMILCILMPTRRRTFWPLVVVLVFLIHVSLFTVMISGAICLGLLVEWFITKSPKPGGMQGAIAVLIIIAATITSLATIWPPKDAIFRKKESGHLDLALPHVKSADHLGRAVSSLWRSYVPIPSARAVDYSNSNIVYERGGMGRRAAVGLGLIVAVLALLSFVDRPLLLLIFAVGTALIAGFFIFQLSGNSRHNGHLYLLLLACWWMRDQFPVWTGPPWHQKLLKIGQAVAGPFMVAIVLMQVCAGAMVTVGDIRHPFSGSRAAADIIRKDGLSDAVIVGNEAHRTSAIAAYLQKPIYFPVRHEFGTYSLLDQEGRAADPQLLDEAFSQFLDRGRKVVLVVENDPLTRDVRAPGYTYTKLGQCPGWSESFQVFRVEKSPATMR